MTTTITNRARNGVDTQALQQLMDDIRADHRKGIARFGVTTKWLGSGPRTHTHVRGWELGGQRLDKNFTITIDEPPELLGTNTAANPQEYLMAAMNACMVATYVAACAVQGIELESLEIESTGELDLRGFLGLDGTVKPGYEQVHYIVRIKGDGTEKQFNEVHEWVKKTSPNYFNMANAITMQAKLEVQ